MKLIQHVEIDPAWPEGGFQANGAPIRLADVETLLPPKDQAGVYFLDPKDPRSRVYPWKNAGYYVDDAGAPVVPAGPLPMSREDLLGLGFTDSWLDRERHGGPPLAGTADTFETQRRRRAAFDSVMAKLYG